MRASPHVYANGKGSQGVEINMSKSVLCSWRGRAVKKG